MTELEFLSPDRARSWRGVTPRPRSPLAGRLQAAGMEDLSLALAKVEVRGDVGSIAIDAEVIPITPARALVLCPAERAAEVRARLRETFATVVDMTAALACVRLPGAALMRRLTELELDRLPASGAVAGIAALVVGGGDDFRILFPQEYGEYVAAVVVDTARGVA